MTVLHNNDTFILIAYSLAQDPAAPRSPTDLEPYKEPSMNGHHETHERTEGDSEVCQLHHMQVTGQKYCMRDGEGSCQVSALRQVCYGTLQAHSPIDVKGMLHRAATSAQTDSAPEPPRPAAASAFSNAQPQASSKPGTNCGSSFDHAAVLERCSFKQEHRGRDEAILGHNHTITTYKAELLSGPCVEEEENTRSTPSGASEAAEATPKPQSAMPTLPARPASRPAGMPTLPARPPKPASGTGPTGASLFSFVLYRLHARTYLTTFYLVWRMALSSQGHRAGSTSC